MVVTSLALVVGAEWGKGVLTLADGTQHPLWSKHRLGGWGGEAMLHGHVYVSTTMADFAGLYAAGELFTIAGGEEAWQCATNTA